MEGAPPLVQEAPVGHILGQDVLEDVDRFLGCGVFVDKLQPFQLPEQRLQGAGPSQIVSSRRKENSRPRADAVCRSRLAASGRRSMRAMSTPWIVSGTAMSA